MAEWQNSRGAKKMMDIEADCEPKISEKLEFHNLAVPGKKKVGKKNRG